MLYGDGELFGEVHSSTGRDERTPASVVMQTPYCYRKTPGR